MIGPTEFPGISDLERKKKKVAFFFIFSSFVFALLWFVR
jgi:hypothetical protein